MKRSRLGETPLPHLETFARAAELGSFTGAAKLLGLTQAAVSQRVQALEHTLNVPLFWRKAGRILLTDAGRTLYDYAERIFTLQRQARREVSGRETPIVGELVLGASSIPGEHFLPTLLPPFHERYPHIQVRAGVTDSLAVIGQVERGEVHLGLVGASATPHTSNSITWPRTA